MDHETDLHEDLRRKWGPEPPEVGQLRQFAGALSVEEWHQIYDAVPLGWTRLKSIYKGGVSSGSSSRRLKKALGDKDAAERISAGRVNFFYHCARRLELAVGVLTMRPELTELDVMVGFGPFRSAIPMTSLGLEGKLVFLESDDANTDLFDVTMLPLV